jgi:hypothetical protein
MNGLKSQVLDFGIINSLPNQTTLGLNMLIQVEPKLIWIRIKFELDWVGLDDRI